MSMTKFGLVLLTSALTITACSGALEKDAPSPLTETPLGWLTGCWLSEDGSVTERWSPEQKGYLFGSAVTTKDDEVVFFEQMRIEPGAHVPVLNAYPRGEGPSAFHTTEQGEHSITFANIKHDYPQRIRYWRDGESLKAEISMFDGSNPSGWIYERCE